MDTRTVTAVTTFEKQGSGINLVWPVVNFANFRKILPNDYRAGTEFP
jgi:hypothetical protein